MVEVPDEMDQALLLLAGEGVVGGVEVGDQDAPESIQELVKESPSREGRYR